MHTVLETFMEVTGFGPLSFKTFELFNAVHLFIHLCCISNMHGIDSVDYTSYRVVAVQIKWG